MLSHPILILTVVSTTDFDVIASMQELASNHHTPACLQSGQYDPGLPRVYLLLHDASDNKDIDPFAALKRLQTRFPVGITRLMVINSLSKDAPNVHQPDMWSRFLIPRYFPESGPSPDLSSTLPRNPLSGAAVLGARLSMEDFMTMREFCISLFNQDIVPWLERKIAFLNKQVSDSRKGVKNVLKSFWRKPKDESEVTKGSVRYKFDKIESQTLFLADLSFMIRDYETALSMYKLVRDDFKADKSFLHLAHTSLMICLCQMLLEPAKHRDLYAAVEALNQALTAIPDLPHMNAFYSHMMAEMYVWNQGSRSPQEAAKVLLQAASTMSRYPLMCGISTERAAIYMLLSGQVKKFIFHEVFAGNKFHRCGPKPAAHGALCFACSMLVLDQSNWGDLKAKLSRALAQDFKKSGGEGARRSLLLMLKLLSSLLNDENDVGDTAASVDLVNIYNEVVGAGLWGAVSVQRGWRELTTRDVLLSALPVVAPSSLDDDPRHLVTTVFDFGVPELLKEKVAIIRSLNGALSVENYNSSEDGDARLRNEAATLQMIEEMQQMLELEKQWAIEQDSSSSSAESAAAMNMYRSLADKWAEVEGDVARLRAAKGVLGSGPKVEPFMRVALGEELHVSLVLVNKLPIDVDISNLKLTVTSVGSPGARRLLDPVLEEGLSEEIIMATDGLRAEISADSSAEIVVSSRPLKVGVYEFTNAFWNLSKHFVVQQPLNKQGPLLQKTLAQRLNRERGEDRSLCFEVVASHPLLEICFKGLSKEVLQGQLLRTTLVIRNAGSAPACNVYIKLSQPSFVFFHTAGNENEKEKESLNRLQPCGLSSTLVKLDENCVIQPHASMQFEAWLRITACGVHNISVLVSYMALRPHGGRECFGPGQKCRTSFISVQTCCLPSLSTSLSLLPKPSSSSKYTLLVDVSNNLKSTLYPRAALRPSIEANRDDVFYEEAEHVDAKMRCSSLGQMDLPANLDEYMEIDEKGLQIAAVWMYGSALPTGGVAAASQGQPSPLKNRLSLPIGAADTLSACFPIAVEELHCAKGAVSWLLSFEEFDLHTPNPTSSSSSSLREMRDKPAEWYRRLVEIAEQFLCVASASKHFEKEVQESRELLALAASDADNAGPRTIAQVRRDRQKAQAVKSAALLAAVAESQGDARRLFANEHVTDSEDTYFSQVPLEEESPPVSGSQSQSAPVSMGMLLPQSVQDLANKEASKIGVGVAFIWLCRWQGKFRWGVESFPHLSLASVSRNLYQPSPGLSSLLPPADREDMTNQICVGIVHPPHLSMSEGSHSLRVPVVVTVRSISNVDLLVNVEATDDVKTIEGASSTSSTKRSEPFSSSAVTFISGEAVWSGRTKYTNVRLNPRKEIRLPFFVVISRSGIYELNR